MILFSRPLNTYDCILDQPIKYQYDRQSYPSERFEEEIAVSMLETVMPEELPVVDGDLPTPGHHQLHDLFKITAKKLVKNHTYALPVFTRLGLMSLALKLAKKSSHGAAS